MKLDALEEIVACLPTDRTLFHYYRNRYAVLLLNWAFPEGVAIKSVKRSRYAPLLGLTPVNEVIARCGQGKIEPQFLEDTWRVPVDSFVLTLGRWGEKNRAQHCQTSRPGFNLVLQVNIHQGHRSTLFDTLDGLFRFRFESPFHPVSRDHQTLCWIRMDLDFETGELLIEEVQTDFMRDLKRVARLVTVLQQRPGIKRAQAEKFRIIAATCNSLEAHFAPIWDQLALSAALWFAREELGFTRIWYHTFESGCRLKRIRTNKPPRSVYTKLPRKFCFEETAEQPAFLMKERRFRRQLSSGDWCRWYLLDLDQKQLVEKPN